MVCVVGLDMLALKCVCVLGLHQWGGGGGAPAEVVEDIACRKFRRQKDVSVDQVEEPLHAEVGQHAYKFQ